MRNKMNYPILIFLILMLFFLAYSALLPDIKCGDI